MAIPLRHVPSVPWAERRPATESAPPQPLAPQPGRGWELWIARTKESLGPLLAVAEAGYGAALLAVAAATAIALMLHLGSEPGIFAPFLVAVVAVALRHGIGPALVAIGSAIIVTYAWFFAPLMALSFDPAALRRLAVFRLGVFAGSGLLITLIAEAHRQTLQELERSRRQLRAFTVNDEIGLQVVGHDGRITWADTGTARMLGYEPEEYVGQPFTSFHADPAVAADVEARLTAGRTVENVHARLRRKDGGLQDVLLNSNTLLGDARTAGTGVLVAVLPLKPAVAPVDSTKLAVSLLLERRRRALADRAAPPSTEAQGDRS
jgi:PAS domain S-box-containing protein